MLYRRGNVWWYKFNFAGRCFQETSRSGSKTIARAAELKRRRDLEEGYHGLKKRVAPRPLSAAAREWLELKRGTLAPKTVRIEQTNLNHLLPVLGSHLLSDVDANDIARYQKERLREGASPKTVNLEIGTLRAILRRHRLWANIQPDVRMLTVRDDKGRAISGAEEQRLLAECEKSRSRSLVHAVTIALNTGMRYSEIRMLRWNQIDFLTRRVTVGKSKTEAGAGRVIPLNDRATATLTFWAGLFADREPSHFVFPSERCGLAGNGQMDHVYYTDPSKPINSWKVSWQSAKDRADVECRFHDLRHTGCTRMLEAGISLPIIGSIFGWSAATAVRMARRYGHIGQVAQRAAVSVLDQAKQPTEEVTERV
jgi:integrase